MSPCYLNLDLPKHVMRIVSSFRLHAHTLAVEMDTVTTVLMLQCKMRCMFFFIIKTICLCSRDLSEIFF